jgi:hypothetical protein
MLVGLDRWRESVMSNSSSANGGISFAGLLTILFIALKLTGYINWSWVWVLSPLWVPLAVVFGLLAVVGVLAGAVIVAMAVRDLVKK